MEVQKLARVRVSPSRPGLHVKQTHRVIELAFAGMMAAWESFLEDTTIHYLAGAATASGYAPTLRMGRCKDISHAYQVYSGKPDYDPNKRFLEWTNPSMVVERARLFFQQGHPYDGPLTEYGPRLLDATKIRNRVAHASAKAGEQFKEVARRLRGGQLHQGFRVGNLLQSPVTAPFGHTLLVSGKTVFEAYLAILRDAAKRIVPT